MGRVFAAYDPRLRRQVAIKFIRDDDPELSRRFISEARAQAKVNHERVCKVYEVGHVSGKVFIAMQYIDGKPLSTLVRALSVEQKAVALREAALGVHEAHRVGLIHRDIKPSNIMVERADDGTLRPYVMDVGLARDWDESTTATGTVLGTPHFMSPEQARGEVGRLDRRADVYSLGASTPCSPASRPSRETTAWRSSATSPAWSQGRPARWTPTSPRTSRPLPSIVGSGCGEPLPGELEPVPEQMAQPLLMEKFQRVRSGVANGRCLEAASSTPANGVNVRSGECSSRATQIWFLTSANELQSGLDSSYCLDVAGAGTANGTRVQLYRCNGTHAQKWYANSRGELRSALGAELCLDVSGASTENGAQVQLWSCNTTTAQQWYTIPALPVSSNRGEVPITISSGSLNGSGNSLVRVQRSTSTSKNWITANVGYTIAQCAYCPGCIDQILIGLSGESTDYGVGCVYDGVPSKSGTQSSGTVSFAAPSTPGVYYLRFRYAQGYSCGKSWWNVDGVPGSEADIGVITVE